MTDETNPVEEPEVEAVAEDQTEAETPEVELDENGEPIEANAEEADDLDDYEHNGKTYKVPRELKEGALRQADYTRKTQALSEERKAVEARAAAIEAEHAEVAKLGGLDREIQQWATWIKDNPNEATPADFVKLQTLQGERAQAAAELQQKRQHAAAEALREDGKALEAMRETLGKEIKGYGPDVEGKIFTFATRDLGFDPQEIAAIRDPRLVKVLHLAMSGQTATRSAARTQAVTSQPTPPTPIKRAAAPTPLSDRASIDAWMKARNQQVRKSG